MKHGRAPQPTCPGRVRRSSNLTRGVVVSLTLLAPFAAFAEDGAEDAPVVACTVSGYDLIIHNRGTDTIASGISVGWSVPFARKQGSHTLAADLEPAGRVFLSGILSPSWMEPGGDCVATIAAEEPPPG
jgi:hypothetical protein